MPFQPFIIPLDTEQRDQRLKVASEALNFPMETDWRPICADGIVTELDEKDEMHIKDVMADGFFEQFGYSYD